LEEDEEETEGMQQHQQRDGISSHAEENAGKQHKEVQVSRGPTGAAAAVLAQDRDIRNQVEAEQGLNFLLATAVPPLWKLEI
jgi:hypothetical protein